MLLKLFNSYFENFYYNRCVGDDTKAAARQSLNCILKKPNMAKNDFQYGGWNSYTLQCGTITTLISSGDCTLQCGSRITCHSIRPNVRHIRILHLIAISTTLQQSTGHSAPVTEILSKSDHPQQKNMMFMSIFKMADLSHLGF